MKRKVPFLDLRVEDDVARQELLDAVDTVFRHGRILLGPEVQELERQIAARCGRKYAVGVNSGTDAVFLALKSLGIGPGDEVITTALSWIATTNAIALTGATPIFADIRDDLNIDPADIRRAITPRTKALLPVHYTGKVCQMDVLMAIAEEHHLLVVEDASQAFDACFQGRKAGSFGDIGCFSMNPMKVFAACGEAGIIVTDREDVAELLVALRYNGTVNRETCIQISLNARLDTLQAAILLKRLPRVDRIVQRRREIAWKYDELLAGVVDIPREGDDEWDIYYTYQIRTPQRDALRSFLDANGIETKIQHPILMPDQPVYGNLSQRALPNARQLVSQILCIPIHEKMSDEDVEYVASCIKSFHEDVN